MSVDGLRAGLRRRDVLGGVALLGAAGAIGVSRVMPGGHKPRLIVYESARPASRALASTGGAVRRIDLTAEARTNWRSLRDIQRGLPIAGFTGWDAYVAARGVLEGQGLRLVSEVLDRQRGLVSWSMA